MRIRPRLEAAHDVEENVPRVCKHAQIGCISLAKFAGADFLLRQKWAKTKMGSSGCCDYPFCLYESFRPLSCRAAVTRSVASFRINVRARR